MTDLTDIPDPERMLAARRAAFQAAEFAFQRARATGQPAPAIQAAEVEMHRAWRALWEAEQVAALARRH